MRITTAALLLALAACSKSPPEPQVGSFRTIPNSLATLTRAIRTKDFELYEQCFTDQANEGGESGLKRIAQDPDKGWARLQAIFAGPQLIKSMEKSGDRARVEIDAPEAKEGGIGRITFERVGDRWLVRSW